MRAAAVALSLLGLAACTDGPPAIATRDASPASRVRWTSPADPRPAALSAAAAARWHLAHHAARYGLDDDALATVETDLVHDTGRGAIVVRLRQRAGGLEVWPAHLAVVMRRDHALVAITGGLHPTPASAPAAFALTADDAVAAALRDLATDATTLTEPARVRPVRYPLAGRLAPAYLSEIRTMTPAGPRGYRHVIAADDGRVLVRDSLDAADAFTYRVWADPAGDHRPADGPLADTSPHPTGVPDDLQPPLTAPALITTAGFDGHGDPWLPPTATEARGNNVDAYADLTAPTGFNAGDVRAPLTGPLRFDATYDPALDPAAAPTQRHGALVQAFYTVNFLHDYFYDSGFDEEAGNAQADNLGRGGVGGDPLLAEGQDYSGFNNANMFTPGDGTSPRMQLFLYSPRSAGGARLDGTVDNLLIAHEWGHYLHHRLVDCGGPLCAGMSEGWGDFVALHLMLRATDPDDGVYAPMSYASQGLVADATYFGLRRYPYSTDLARNPLTLRHLRTGEPLPAGVPMNAQWAGPGNFEVHNAGEIWAVTMFEGLMALVRESRTTPPRYSFADARRRMADYVVAGLIAIPVNPTLTEQRDAILAAAAASDLRDARLLAEAFARRGLGTAALSPPATTTTGNGLLESFTVVGRLGAGAITLGDGTTPCDGDGVLDANEVGEVRVSVVNTGGAPLLEPTVVVTSPTPGVAFPTGDTVALAPLAPFEARVATIPIALTSAAATDVTIVAALHDPGALAPSVGTQLTIRVNLDRTPIATDGFEGSASSWTATSRWVRFLSTVTGTMIYFVPDVTVPADERLVSPPMTVAAGAPLVLAFHHRYAFPIGVDGAVIEYSRDGGQTWLDVATLTNPGYSIILDGAQNPLHGRPAYSGPSPGFPMFTLTTLDLGTSLAGAAIRFRFRVGTAGSVGDHGWDLDDVTVTGTVTPPFAIDGPEDGVGCPPGHRPVASAGPDQAVTAGDAVVLDGTASSDAEGPLAAYAWTQVGGPPVALGGAATAQPDFAAPPIDVVTEVAFELVVRDNDGLLSAPDGVRVEITPRLDAGVDATVDAPADAGLDAAVAIDAAGPDASPPAAIDDGGCCGAAGDPRGSMLGALLAAALLRRRQR